MEGKKIAAVIGAIDVVLFVVCLALHLGKDRKGPEIFFREDNQTVYEEGMDESLLLVGVTAVDEKDGDVSDSLLVEKVAGTNGREVIVTYVARDGANNVGKASRAFAAAKDYNAGEGLAEEAESQGVASSKDEDETAAEAQTGTEDGIESQGESESAGNETGQDGGHRNETDREETVAANPVLVLNSNVITTRKGAAPNWNEVIETMSDDEDSYNVLYDNLKLEGQVRLNEEGEYPVTLYTVDSDGKRSEVWSLVVRVE